MHSRPRFDRKLLQKKSYANERASNEFTFCEVLHERQAGAC